MTRLYTLGRFALVTGAPEEERRIAIQPKRLVLLAYLAAASPRGPQRRDTLLSLFWPELGHDEARRALRQALHYLRRHVGEAAIDSRADDQVSVTAALWADVERFEECLDGDEAEALALYAGDFLAGVHVDDVAPEFEEWVDRTRSGLRAAAGAAAWRLSERREAQGDVTGACAAAVRAHELSPDDEGALRRVLGVLERHGERARALRLFESFAQRMQGEFGVTPAEETVAVIRRLQAAPARMPERGAEAPRGGGAREFHQGDERPAAHSADVVTTTARTATPVRPRRSRHPIGWLAAAVAVMALLALPLLRDRDAGGVAGAEVEPSPYDRVFVADFADLAGDSTLARAVSEAVRTDIAQYPGVRVLSPQRIASALRRSTLSRDVVIDDSLARELGVREGVKAIVTGDVSRVGDRYMISARLVGVDDGELIASTREQSDSTQLVEAIGRVTRRLRRDLGESLGSLRQSPPLREVTTASLPALRRYTEALYLHEERGEREAALRSLQEALAIDSGFASALRAVGAIHSANANPGLATEALRRAFAHRSRLAVRERYLTMGSYYRNVTHEHDKAVEAYVALLRLYPRDVAGLNNLSLVYADQRAYAPAETLLRRLIAIDSSIPSVYLGLGQSLINQGSFTEARTLLDDVARRFPDFPITPLTETYLAAGQQDWAAAERHIRVRLERGLARGRLQESADAYLTLGQIMLIGGRLGDSDEALRQGAITFEHLEAWRRVLFAAVQLGWLELRHRGRPQLALALVDSVLARVPLATISSSDRPYAELAELFVALDQPDRAADLLRLAESDTASRVFLEGAGGHALRGYVALGERRHRPAIVELRRAAATDRCPVCVLPGLAQALEASGDLDGAAATYQRYFRTPWMHRFETDAPHLAHALERSAALQARAGRRADAVAQLDVLLLLWRNSDAELAPKLEQVERMRAQLARDGG